MGGLAAKLAGVPVVVSTGYTPAYWRPPFLSVVGQAAFAAYVDALVSDADFTIDLYRNWLNPLPCPPSAPRLSNSPWNRTRHAQGGRSNN
jgi:hypothetical protein